jgi:hypothetical protein
MATKKRPYSAARDKKLRRLEALLTCGVLGLSAIGSVDARYTPPVIAKTFNVEPLWFPAAASCTEKNIAICRETALEIREATALWRKAKQKQGVTVPGYINLAYALKVASIESLMGSLPDRENSRFGGTLQFSLDKDTHYPHVIEETRYAMAAVRDELPFMSGFPRFTPDVMKRKDVFHKTTTQVFALLETALKSDVDLMKNHDYAKASTSDKHTALYLWHNLPATTGPFLRYRWCEMGMTSLVPVQAKNIASNPAVYGDKGVYSPDEVAFAFNRKSAGFLNQAAEFLGDETLKVEPEARKPRRYWQYGLMSATIGKASNYLWRCVS